MVPNRPITLKIADPGDFWGIYSAFALILILAASLSPHPAIILLLSCCLFAFCQFIARKPTFTPQNRASALLIFPAGNISLIKIGTSADDGVLGYGHWITRRLAVLAVVIGSKTHRLVLLASQQNADDYRRLRVCIQHKFAVRDQ